MKRWGSLWVLITVIGCGQPVESRTDTVNESSTSQPAQTAPVDKPKSLRPDTPDESSAFWPPRQFVYWRDEVVLQGDDRWDMATTPSDWSSLSMTFSKLGSASEREFMDAWDSIQNASVKRTSNDVRMALTKLSAQAVYGDGTGPFVAEFMSDGWNFRVTVKRSTDSEPAAIVAEFKSSVR
ncbi:hypothetical protein V7x_20480 [Crateriforma conspicua]|uniref:Uncharacterized protein n=2 Tax=Planctomycetaceae TaxID=126 RepID=A0A5C6FTW8_9PLAN|nr:hypothetical protein V7x_20480 [Crateriforma conspicua]